MTLDTSVKPENKRKGGQKTKQIKPPHIWQGTGVMSFPDQDYKDILAQRCHGRLNCKTSRYCLEKRERPVYHWNSVLEWLMHVYAEFFLDFLCWFFRENPVWEALVLYTKEWLIDSLRKESLNSHAWTPWSARRECLYVSALSGFFLSHTVLCLDE